ncbi:sigma-70 family RNA polymerase sigma factor [Marinococcus halotolerans]|uniref:sigma-70 family RNA polymerase sigma factor n=1 Tax=Marinococcus halotolerans TaxID=301092 RepID=UPI0003B50D64|nr:sigma-70 family RNA polymerase sigma factor [Marinococcus halotolerans]
MKQGPHSTKQSSYDRLWRSFLTNDTYQRLFDQYHQCPTHQHYYQLEHAFHRFVQEQRVVAYLAKTIHYTAVQFDQKERRFLDRNQRWLDRDMDEGYTQREYSLAINSGQEEGPRVQRQFVDEAWEQLTEKQQQVLDFSFVDGYTDEEIGRMLGQSQQSVSRLKQRALQRMRAMYQNKS